MIQYVVYEACYNCSSKPIGLAVRLWMVRFYSVVFVVKEAANGCGKFGDKLRISVCKQVGWDLERDYAMIKEQLSSMLRTLLRRRYCLQKFRVLVDENQNVQIIFWCPW